MGPLEETVEDLLRASFWYDKRCLVDTDDELSEIMLPSASAR